ncbi:DsbA family protein [Candidatus Peregrinibacteria bacterium]|nr:DsbA family protein [Candidatus Peregrinibacteria bacterium]
MKKFFLLFVPFLLAGCALTPEDKISKIVDQKLAEYVESADFDAAIESSVERLSSKNQLDQQKAALREQKQAAEKAKNVRALSDEDHLYGNKSAEIVLFEYSDFECPFCAKFHPTAKEVVDNSSGKVAWVYRHFPLSFHPGSQKKAEASECVAKLGGNSAFWKFADGLFGAESLYPVSDLSQLAAKTGVNATSFQSCLDSGEMTEKVKTSLSEGTSVGVSGTPGNILLNTKTSEVRVLGGAVPKEVVETAISELKK